MIALCFSSINIVFGREMICFFENRLRHDKESYGGAYTVRIDIWTRIGSPLFADRGSGQVVISLRGEQGCLADAIYPLRYPYQFCQ